MRAEFKTELAKIANDIKKIIQKDDFPNSIKPKFLKEAVRDYPLREGKKLRPALIIWTCGLFGGKIEKAKFAAAASEIFHNWTLVHDDIIDNDDFRRALPSTHRQIANFAKKKYHLNDVEAEVFGRNNAILTGDIQQAWAINLLSKTPVSEKTLISLIRDLLSLGGRDLISGEALDVEISSKKWQNINLKQLIEIAEKKTARLLQFCALCGAKIANDGKESDKKRISMISDFAKFAGIAFQLKDDLIGVFEDNTGKPVLSDLSEKKPTTIFLEAIRLLDKRNLDFILSLSGKRNFSRYEIQKLRGIVSDCGAKEKCQKRAEKFKKSAISILLSFEDCEFRKLLLDWTEFVIDRNK